MYRRSAAEKPRKDSAGFYTLRGRKFLHRNFRTSVFCAVRTHLPEKRELFGKIKAARGADG